MSPALWEPDEIEAAIVIAEASKHPGELPEPISSWRIEGDVVREIEPTRSRR